MNNRPTSLTDLKRDIWQVITKVGKLTQKDCAQLNATCRQLHHFFSPNSTYMPSLFGLALPIINYSQLLSDIPTIELDVSYDNDGFVADNLLIALPNCRIACASKAKKTIDIWDVNTRVKLMTLEHSHNIRQLILVPGNMLASLAADGNINFWEIYPGKFMSRIKAQGASEFIYISKKTIATLVRSYGLTIHDLTTGKKVAIEHKNLSWIISLPNERIACGTNNEQILIFDINTKEIIHTLYESAWSTAPNTINCLSRYAHDKLISGAHNGVISIWDINTGKCLKSFETIIDSYPVKCISLLSDNILVSSTDEQLRVWNINTRKCLNTYHREKVIRNMVALSDGSIATYEDNVESQYIFIHRFANFYTNMEMTRKGCVIC